ncbi:hypothetical protein C0J52_16696 [Blattella germanica]|nr:hypothetical protein C0J52_16696 [Blattella germanica]
MVQGEQGCPLVKPQASFLETAETVGAGMFLKLQETSGLSRWLSNGNQGAVTILAPSNQLITVNCVPIIETDIQTTQGILHIIEAPLEDKSLYTIAEVISQHRELRRLGTFIAQANFEKTLRLSGPFTFFAPTDEAFNSISDDKLQFLLYNEQALQALMNHHLVEGVYCLSALHNTTLNTKAKTIVRSRCTLKGTKVSGASISRNNIMASNGVIHLIDQVLIPRRAKSLMDLLDDLGLTKLKSLLPTAGLQSAFKGRGTITVFAPSNQALEAFGNSTVFNSQMEIRTLLAGHMVSGRLLTRNLLDKQELQTLSHHKVLRTKIYNSRTMVNDGVIVKPDIEGSNGVIHIVNKVLKPPKFSIIQYLQSQGTYSRFLSALNRTSPSLIELLESDNAPFTVFAVTDASIDSWSADLFTYDRMMADTRIVNSIMRNHVVADTLYTSVLVSGNYYQMMNLNSEPLLIRRWYGQKGPIYAGIALIQNPDILCTNGVVHVVNRLIQLAYPSYS